MARIFPQADDLDKIIKIIYIDNIKFETDYLKSTLKLGTSRQIDYYLSACKFLDILDTKKEFTQFGEKLRLVSRDTMFNLLVKKIVSKDVFGECFFSSLRNKNLPTRDDVAQVILTMTEIDNYSVAYRRFSDCIILVETYF